MFLPFLTPIKNSLGVRRSLRSLHEFSFAPQVVSILLRKTKKTRAVGLSAIPLSLQPLPSLRSVQWPPVAWLQSLTHFIIQLNPKNVKYNFCISACAKRIVVL
jgi:hypothetical protein